MPRVISLIVPLALLILTAACGADENASSKLLDDWPPFIMVYEADGPVYSAEGGQRQVREVRRFEFQSKNQWVETVIEATPMVVPTYGTFSTAGSYTRLSGRQLTEFDASTNHFIEDEIDEGERFIPSAYLAPFQIRILEEVMELTPTRVETGFLVCFREQCEENAVGLLYRLDNGREEVFADDLRGFPLKMEDNFLVKELRVDDERRDHPGR